MSINTTGIVVELDSKEVKTKFGMKPTYSFKLDDNVWYRCGFKDPKLGVGMKVDFSYTPGKYGNDVTEGSITASKATVGAASAVPRSGGKGVFPVPPDDGQRSIVRQNALTNARELVCHLLPAGVNKEDYDNLPSVAFQIIETAKLFESYTAGDDDLASVEGELATH